MDFSILPPHPQSTQPVFCRDRYTFAMLRRFTEHPASINETYFQHLAMAFGFGGRLLLGGLAWCMGCSRGSASHAAAIRSGTCTIAW
jgi:hypothetical protein